MVEPILQASQPKVIVEIGSSQGVNTENLLEYCRRHDARLHVIEPAPLYDVEAFGLEYGERFVLHEGLSLDILPEIESFDAVLIDGDHNWYTVFNELKLIEQKSLENSQDFPLVLLHDVGWPYGRRDLYYDPDTIPKEHRKPYAKKGISWGEPGLVPEGGMNQNLDNAVMEGEPEEGVLTAVEDFLGETGYEVELQKLPGIHGLGVLAPKQLREKNPRLDAFLEELDFPPHVESYIEGLERARLEQEIYHQKERREYRRALADESARLREARQRTREAHDRLKNANQDVARLNQDVARLIQWTETLDEGVSAVLRSRQWKIGGAVAKLYRKVFSGSKKPLVEERLKNTSEEFRTWQRR